MAGRLQGKVAVITGGGSGIGAAAARLFAAEGASVLITGRRPEPLQEVAAHSGRIIPIAGDASDDEHIHHLVSQALDLFGRIDVVVANAGITNGASVLDMTGDNWESMLRINLTAAMKLAKAVLPNMIERGSGSIVNVSSVSGLSAVTDSASYMVSKTGLIALTRSLAIDYGKYGVRVNTLCPGWVRTPMSEKSMNFLAAKEGVSQEEAFSLATQHLPLRRAAQPAEIANCCLFLASDESSFVTGITLVADGGGEIVDVGGLAFAD